MTSPLYPPHSSETLSTHIAHPSDAVLPTLRQRLDTAVAQLADCGRATENARDAEDIPTTIRQLARLGRAFGEDLSFIEADYEADVQALSALRLRASLTCLLQVFEGSLMLLDAEASALSRIEATLSSTEALCQRLRGSLSRGRVACGMLSMAPSAIQLPTVSFLAEARALAGCSTVGRDSRDLAAELESMHRENAALRVELLGSTSDFSDVFEPEELSVAFEKLQGLKGAADNPAGSPLSSAEAELRVNCSAALSELRANLPVLVALPSKTESSLEHVALQTLGHVIQLLDLGAATRRPSEQFVAPLSHATILALPPPSRFGGLGATTGSANRPQTTEATVQLWAT